MNKGDAHVYLDGKHYDAMHQHLEDDIEFYIDCVEKYGEPVLELACGTGRVTLSLAKKGIDVTGIDISEVMLQRGRHKAEEKDLRLKLVQADMTDFSFDRTFNTILLPVNTLQTLLELEEHEALFSTVHDHLSEGGRFIFQIFNPDLDILTRDPKEKFDVIEYEDPYGRGEIQVKESTRYASSTQILQMTWYYYLEDELYKEIDWKLRILFPKEIDALLKLNGFEVENKYGDHDGSEFTDESGIQLIVAKKSD
ncbi:MAG: class I SAM-dependent methyltransferase [Candidatus Natronoplasma sp.]